jgi:hypothetical protein
MYLIILVQRPNVLSDLGDQLIQDGVIVFPSKLVQELFYSHGMLTQVLHVYLPLNLVDEIQSGSWHTEFTDSIHVLALLKHNIRGSYLIFNAVEVSG